MVFYRNTHNLSLIHISSPSAFRYAVRYEGHTDLAPYEFFECCNEKSDDEILGAAVQHYDVDVYKRQPLYGAGRPVLFSEGAQEKSHLSPCLLYTSRCV